jgi:hypothetical protein
MLGFFVAYRMCMGFRGIFFIGLMGNLYGVGNGERGFGNGDLIVRMGIWEVDEAFGMIG